MLSCPLSARQNPQFSRTQPMSLLWSFSLFPHWDKSTPQLQFHCFLSNSILYHSYSKPQQYQVRLHLCQSKVLSTRATGLSQHPRSHHHHDCPQHPWDKGLHSAAQSHSCFGLQLPLKTNRTEQAKGEAAQRGRFWLRRPRVPEWKVAEGECGQGTEQQAHEMITGRWRCGDLGCVYTVGLRTNWSSLLRTAFW